MTARVDTEHGHTPAALKTASQACQEDSSLPMIDIPCAYSTSAYKAYLAPSNESPTVKTCLEHFASVSRNLRLRD